jgi:subtilisin family serine protease
LAPTVRKLVVGKTISIKIVDDKGNGVSGLPVVGFTDFEARAGADGKTNTSGIVVLKLAMGTKKLERLYVYPPNTYWPLMKKNLVVSAAMKVELSTIDSFRSDSLRHFYGGISDKPIGGSIKVGVIDTGVGPHHAINVVGGECTVEGEDQGDTNDYDGHGTHVSGIISSFGKNAAGNPAIEICIYRVFPKKGGGASNYSIVKAIDRAVGNGCLLINMSLGGGDPDDATKDAITDAHAKGVICFVATGNDDRATVCFPANFSTSLAVGAMGRKGTFPANAEANDSVKAPYGKDKKNFVASFSNIGPEVDFVGTGVGIVSCAPNNGYAVMSGTSMACPAATGIAGRLLVDEGQIIRMPADSNRSNAMIKFLGTKAKEMGFGKIYEGGGMILP